MRGTRKDLARLSRFNRWVVIKYWRALLWGQVFRRLPFPARLAILNAPILFCLLSAAPPPPMLMIRGFILFWISSLCIAIAIIGWLPGRRRVHWLHAIVDDEHEQLHWQ